MAELLELADRNLLIDLQGRLEQLRPVDADYLVVSVGVRGPNVDCRNGNAVAIVRMGDDTATAEALHLTDAIALARGSILRERQTRENKRKEAQS